MWLDESDGIHGTTSACAENTGCQGGCKTWEKNYLRVRGEYNSSKTLAAKLKELPPRARRIPGGRGGNVQIVGTTSACAENTWGLTCCFTHIRNYLRVRGEYSRHMLGGMGGGELPPRARRIRRRPTHPVRMPGTTSACAENTY